MKRELKVLRCKHCGNMVTYLKDSGAPITCCGEHMEEVKANSTDAVQEKHVPAIAKEDDTIFVRVGSVTHPMLPEHYIEWVACVTENKVEFKYFQPGEDPEAVFNNVTDGIVYEYCNIHGLWKAEF